MVGRLSAFQAGGFGSLSGGVGNFNSNFGDGCVYTVMCCLPRRYCELPDPRAREAHPCVLSRVVVKWYSSQQVSDPGHWSISPGGISSTKERLSKKKGK